MRRVAVCNWVSKRSFHTFHHARAGGTHVRNREQIEMVEDARDADLVRGNAATTPGRECLRAAPRADMSRWLRTSLGNEACVVIAQTYVAD